MLVFSKQKRQENGTDNRKLRPLQNTTGSNAIAFLVRKGPLGKPVHKHALHVTHQQQTIIREKLKGNN